MKEISLLEFSHTTLFFEITSDVAEHLYHLQLNKENIENYMNVNQFTNFELSNIQLGDYMEDEIMIIDPVSNAQAMYESLGVFYFEIDKLNTIKNRDEFEM